MYESVNVQQIANILEGFFFWVEFCVVNRKTFLSLPKRRQIGDETNPQEELNWGGVGLRSIRFWISIEVVY